MTSGETKDRCQSLDLKGGKAKVFFYFFEGIMIYWVLIITFFDRV